MKNIIDKSTLFKNNNHFNGLVFYRTEYKHEKWKYK